MFSTIHVFGYGETQLIGKDKNGKVKNTDLTKMTDFVNHVKGFKPADVQDADIHAIHIFNNQDVRYLGKGTGTGTGNLKEKTSFSVKWADIDATIVNDFVSEVESKLP